MKTLLLPRLVARVAARLPFLLIGILSTSVVFSQAKLVKDMNRSENPLFNEYSQIISAQGVFYFVSHGKELWKSDGTSAGTVRVKVLREIQNLTLIGNTLYFAGTDGNGAELWKSDGTAAGTRIIKNIRPGVAGSAPSDFIILNGTIFFVADDGRGYELWKTDGTLTGTVLVRDIRPGALGSEPRYLTVMNNILYFTANNGIHGRELWRSDGTAGATLMVKDIQAPEGQWSDPLELAVFNGFLYFSAHQSNSGRELWRSDGTANRTTLVKDIYPGPGSSGIGSIRRMGYAIYFTANNGSTGTALWRSSGTSAGTVMVKDLTPDYYEHETHDMTVINNRMYWLINNNYVHEVWVSNGTAAGTSVATSFERRDMPARFTYMNNKIFFFGGYFGSEIYAPFKQLFSMNPDGSGAREIWSMQTPYSVAGDQYYDTLEMIAFKNALFFPGVRSNNEGYKLLKSNGTETGLTLLVDTYKPTLPSWPTLMTKTNFGIFFLTGEYSYTPNLWRTDGTSPGTIRIKSLQTISNFISIDNTIYFSGWGHTSVQELWKTDGTPAGTRLIKQLEHHPSLVNVAGTLFFYNDAGELWKSNGTAAGTILLKQFPGIEHVAASGNIAYVMVRTVSGGQELWKSNGTPAGTVKVRTIRWVYGPSTSNHVTSVTLGNIFYFVGHNGTHGYEMWRTDGTNAGTFMLKDIRTGDNAEWGTDIWRATAFNNALYINAMDANGEFSLFISDGTREGTKEIYDSYQVLEFIPYKDQLLFVAAGSLFSTDGTTAGTMLLHELSPSGWSISHIQSNGILYLGYEGSDVLWRSDGTECGTFGINVGLRNINNLAPAGPNILFSADHDYYGNELFAFNLSDVSVPSCPEVFAARQETSADVTYKDETENITYGPNPFDSDFTVVVNSDHQSTAEISVHDMAGHPVMLDILETNRPHDLGNNWEQGLYVMRIVVDGKVTVKRVIKGRQ